MRGGVTKLFISSLGVREETLDSSEDNHHPQHSDNIVQTRIEPFIDKVIIILKDEFTEFITIYKFWIHSSFFQKIKN